MVELVSVGDSVQGCIDREDEEEYVGDVPKAGSELVLYSVFSRYRLSTTYLDCTLGIIVPPVKDSTRRTKGIIDKTL